MNAGVPSGYRHERSGAAPIRFRWSRRITTVPASTPGSSPPTEAVSTMVSAPSSWATRGNSAGMSRNPGRWEPREVGERERDLDLQIGSDRRTEAGAEDEPDRRDQVGPRS